MVEFSLFAVTGNPVLHSRSPEIFNALFKHDAIEATYSRIAADNCATALYLFNELNVSGMNVTAPFKEEMLAAVDEREGEAHAIGSVNTVIRVGGRCRGLNTDHTGVIAALLAHGCALPASRCTVLGGGGAARAAAYGLTRQGSEVTVINRTHARAVEIAERFGCHAARLEEAAAIISSSDILVSAISPHADSIDGRWLHPRLTVLDANYYHSPLLRVARRRGCRVIGGIEWLLQQALPAYAHFVGKNGDVRVGRDALDRGGWDPRKATAIALIGFMGCGKSAVAAQLAERLNFACVDTDEEIEKRAGEPIRDIFRNRGESHFRALEKQVLYDLRDEKKIVISCGGGAVLDEENRGILANAVVIWLYVPIRVCVERIDTSTRPLIDCDTPLQSASRLFESRVPYYARSADLIVDGRASAPDVAGTIYEEINQTFGGER